MVLFPAVQLVFNKPLGLLPAMVCSINHGLRTLTAAFCKKGTAKPRTEGGAELQMPRDGPLPRVELPYTYLMAWFVMHCPALIKHIDESTLEGGSAFLSRLANSRWSLHYIAGIRKIIAYYDNYSLYRCFPNISGTSYDEEFQDIGTSRTTLGHGPFRWLVSIRPSNLLCRLGDTCLLEPYVPCRFARQFGYDQLYVGNPNTKLCSEGSLIDGARAWRHFVMGCTGARFCMPS